MLAGGLAFLWRFMSPWRNRLARSAVNRKVGGSSPPGDGESCLLHQSPQIACTAYTNAHIVHVFIRNTGEKTAKEKQDHSNVTITSN